MGSNKDKINTAKRQSVQINQSPIETTKKEVFEYLHDERPWDKSPESLEKDFWLEFPNINFYDEKQVKRLLYKYQENKEIMQIINKELRLTLLDKEFKHYLSKIECEKQSEKAKKLVDSAIENWHYANHFMRNIVVIEINENLTIPFYQSTWMGGKKWVKSESFYPFFWIWDDWWINKWRRSEMNNYYWIPLFAAIATELNRRYESGELDTTNRESSNKSFEKYVNLWKTPRECEDIPIEVYSNINKTLTEYELYNFRNDVKEMRENGINIKEYFLETIENFMKLWKYRNSMIIVNRYFQQIKEENLDKAVPIFEKLINLWYLDIAKRNEFKEYWASKLNISKVAKKYMEKLINQKDSEKFRDIIYSIMEIYKLR